MTSESDEQFVERIYFDGPEDDPTYTQIIISIPLDTESD